LANDRFLIVGLGRQHHRDTTVPTGANRVVFDLEAALENKPVCAIVANPASMHEETGLALAKAGVHLLVEKPLTDSMKGVDRLISVCETNNLVLMVAYVLRFNEGLNVFRQAVLDGRIGRVLSFRAEVGQYLPDWRPGSDYRTSVSARKELGGGALLELSHELDYICWIFGQVKTVSADLKNTGLLDIDVEDLVDGILEVETEDGSTIVGTVHLDMLQRAPYRSCRAIGEAGTIEWNAIEGTVCCFDANLKTWQTLYYSTSTDRNELYTRQIKSFLNAVQHTQAAVVAGEDGKAVLKIIEAIRESAASRKQVILS
jgi:predicted dehydrogenase